MYEGGTSAECDSCSNILNPLGNPAGSLELPVTKDIAYELEIWNIVPALKPEDGVSEVYLGFMKKSKVKEPVGLSAECVGIPASVLVRLDWDDGYISTESDGVFELLKKLTVW